MKQNLQYNIRRRRWEAWYREHRWLRHPVAWFWLTSDYGRSTLRVLGAFGVWAAVFTAAYFVFGLLEWCQVIEHGLVANLAEIDGVPVRGVGDVLWRSLYFSVVTMTTLGFGDMHAHPESWLGYPVLMAQVLLGYGLLGALVTRFAVMFTAGGPAETYRPIPSGGKAYRRMVYPELPKPVGKLYRGAKFFASLPWRTLRRRWRSTTPRRST